MNHPAIAALAARLRDHVTTLADTIGPRGLFDPPALHRAEGWIAEQLAAMGHTVGREPVTAAEGISHNVMVEISGQPLNKQPGIWIVGAHYDTVADTPGADDNASAVAILLEMARALRAIRPAQTIRLVFLTNEEAPWFTTPGQGAMVHAQGCRARGEPVRLMASLEMLGYFTDAPDSQRYPPGIPARSVTSSPGCRPEVGNFVAFVGSKNSAARLTELVNGFHTATHLPSQTLAAPVWAPALIRSDHYAFVLHRYPAVLITDTADFRNPHYHSPADTPDTLNYTAMAHVTRGLVAGFSRLAGGQMSSPGARPDG